MTRLLAAALVAALFPPITQDGIDPSLLAAVERFYAMQEAEDVDGYLSLWASSVARPQREQLKYIFDSGDDRFSALRIERVTPNGDRTVVRVSVTRDRTSAAARRADGSPMTFHTAMNSALTYVRESGEWKLVREGSPIDALAEALIAAPTPGARDELLAAEPQLVGPFLVSAIARQADTFAQSGAHARAQQVYERALELATRVGHTKLQAELLQNIGNAMYYQRNFAGARRAYEQRLAIERAAGNDDGVANAMLGIATAQYSQFEYSDALVSYQEALAIHERLKDDPAVATTLVSTGNVLFVQGDFAGAVAAYRRSRALYRMGMNTHGEARALEGLGRALAAQGDFGAALEAYAGVLEEGRSRSDRGMQGTALSSIGEVHFRLGNLDAARERFDQSRLHFEATKDLPNVGRAWQAIALTDLVSSRMPAAEQEYVNSAAACSSAQDPDCVARAIVGLAFAQAAQEHYAPAIASYRKAIASFTSLTKREDAARAEIGLSQALAATRDYTGALAAARHATAEGVAMDRHDVVWRGRIAEARALRRLPSPARALTAAKLAVAAVERLALASLDQPGEQLPSDTTGAYALLAVLQAETGDVAGAFATVERRRVHALRGALAANERDIARGMTSAERDGERQLAARVVSIRAQFDHEKALPKPDPTRLARLKQSLAAAVDGRRGQQQELFTRLPDLRTWRGLGAAATLDDSARALSADGEILAQFVLDDDDLLALVLSREAGVTKVHASLTSISRQTLAERVARALEPAALRNVDAWRAACADLMNAIPAGAWSLIAAAQRVIVVPDEVLWRVPFEALPVDGGFLADRTIVLYAGSATSLVATPASSAPSEALTLLAVGAPELSSSRRDAVAGTSPGWTLRPSEGADAEAHAIGSVFDDSSRTILTGPAATEASFRTQASTSALLHVSAPFRMNGASPLFSSILLSSDSSATEQATDNDGALQVRELMNLDLRARVAVLSDGASMSMRGAAPAASTVRWAWRAAGVPSIVLARWGSDADAAASLVREFYAGLKAGDAPDRALQAASAAVRASEDTRAPYFWATWMVVGRPDQRNIAR